MSTDYELHIKNSGGVLKHVLTDMRGLAYVREVNAAGWCRFDLDGSHAAIGTLAPSGVIDPNAQIEVWRRSRAFGIDWQCDFYGLMQDDSQAADDDGLTTYSATCAGQLSLLGRAVVGYKSGVSNRSNFAAAKGETVLKNLVKYNATSSGTTGDGRIRTVTIAGVSVATDAAGGNTIDVACAWRNLLATLQDVAAIAGGDFDLVRTAATSWEFRWYAGQLGTDRSATVTFALERGNMAKPVLTRIRSRERTVAIVAGQGEGNARSTVVRTSSSYAAGTRDAEMYLDARDLTATAGLEDRGDQALSENRALDALSFDVIQTPGCAYGLHYFLGDRVKANFAGVSVTKKVQRVSVELATSGDERIAVELVNV